MMDVLYPLPSRQLLCSVDRGRDEAIGQHTLYPPISAQCATPARACVRVHVRSDQLVVPPPTEVPPAEKLRATSSLPICPGAASASPGLAVLTGGVAAVMDDRALAFCVRVLHLCYLPCGSLSKTSCRVSSAPPPSPFRKPPFSMPHLSVFLFPAHTHTHTRPPSSSRSSLGFPLFSRPLGPPSEVGAER